MWLRVHASTHRNPEVVLDAPPEQVWEAITDPAALREWLAPEVELEAQRGRRAGLPLRGRRGAPRRGRAGRGGRTPRLPLVARGRRPEPGRVRRRRRRRRHPPDRHRDPRSRPTGRSRDRRSPRGVGGVRAAAGAAPRGRPPGPRLSRWRASTQGRPRTTVGAVFGALADPTRRHLVEALAAEPGATATGLAATLPISRQAVAKHLKLLGDAGLVSRRRRGREARFELDHGAAGRGRRLDRRGRRRVGREPRPPARTAEGLSPSRTPGVAALDPLEAKPEDVQRDRDHLLAGDHGVLVAGQREDLEDAAKELHRLCPAPGSRKPRRRCRCPARRRATASPERGSPPSPRRGSRPGPGRRRSRRTASGRRRGAPRCRRTRHRRQRASAPRTARRRRSSGATPPAGRRSGVRAARGRGPAWRRSGRRRPAASPRSGGRSPRSRRAGNRVRRTAPSPRRRSARRRAARAEAFPGLRRAVHRLTNLWGTR